MRLGRKAANERANLFASQNVLVLPVEADDDVAGEPPASHLIGAYAHRVIMEAVRSRGYQIIADTTCFLAWTGWRRVMPTHLP
jgi:hypothetical protein